MNEKWMRRFLGLAEYIASWSKDPSTKCGAVIVRPDHRTIASLGFNGFPKGMRDDPDLYKEREIKLRRVIHCEINAIIFAAEPLAFCTLFTWPLLTCSRCSLHVIQAGIRTVVAPHIWEPELRARWGDDLEEARANYSEAGVQVVELL